MVKGVDHIPSSIRRHFESLCILHKVKKGKVLRDILKSEKKSLRATLIKIAKNLLIGNIPITRYQKDKLKKFSKTLRSIYKATDFNKQSLLLLSNDCGLVFLIIKIIVPVLLKILPKTVINTGKTFEVDTSQEDI
mgnify:FL=1